MTEVDERALRPFREMRNRLPGRFAVAHLVIADAADLPVEVRRRALERLALVAQEK